MLTDFIDGIAASAVLSTLNYILLGLAIETDGYYLHSFEVFLAILAVFPGSGNVGYTLLEYRLGHRSMWDSLVETCTWVPFLYVSVAYLRPRLMPMLVAFSSLVVLASTLLPLFWHTCSHTTSLGEQRKKKSNDQIFSSKFPEFSSASGSPSHCLSPRSLWSLSSVFQVLSARVGKFLVITGQLSSLLRKWFVEAVCHILKFHTGSSLEVTFFSLYVLIAKIPFLGNWLELQIVLNPWLMIFSYWAAGISDSRLYWDLDGLLPPRYISWSFTSLL